MVSGSAKRVGLAKAKVEQVLHDIAVYMTVEGWNIANIVVGC